MWTPTCVAACYVSATCMQCRIALLKAEPMAMLQQLGCESFVCYEVPQTISDA